MEFGTPNQYGMHDYGRGQPHLEHGHDLLPDAQHTDGVGVPLAEHLGTFMAYVAYRVRHRA